MPEMSRSVAALLVRRVIRATALVASAVVFGDCGGSIGGFTGPFLATVSGVVSSSLGGPLANVAVNVTPTGYPTLADTTSANGAYAVLTVLVATGTVTFPSVPAGCTPPAPVAYTADKNFNAFVNVTVTCEAPIDAARIPSIP